MKQNLQLTAVIERQGDGFVSLCPALDIVAIPGSSGRAAPVAWNSGGPTVHGNAALRGLWRAELSEWHIFCYDGR